MNNYLASIAARTLNPDPVVLPRLSSRFEPAPPLPELSFERSPVSRSRAKPHSPGDADVDSPVIDETLVRPRPSAHGDRTLNLRAATPPSDVHPPSVNVAVSSTFAAQNANSTAQLSSGRAPEHKTLVKPDPEPHSAPVEERSIEQRPNVASIRRAAVTNNEPRLMVRAEPRIDDPPKPVSIPRDAENVKREPRVAEESPRTVKPFLNVSDDEQHLMQPSARARPAIERELETVIIREKRVLDESAREVISTTKPAPAVVPWTAAREHQSGNPPPLTQTRIAPKVEVAPERLAPSSSVARVQPTVQVTIGRIEIRAVQSSQPAVKPRATTPVMNLDDYLRRRSRGSGR